MVRPSAISHASALAAALFAIAAAASAQRLSAPTPGERDGPYDRRGPFAPREPGGMRLADQGVDDVGPLSTSLRDVNNRVELRRDSAWERVYRDPGTGLLYRYSGGLGASFRRSAYTPTRNGAVAEIPAGTVYHIGASSPRHADLAGVGARTPRPQRLAAATDEERAEQPDTSGNAALSRPTTEDERGLHSPTMLTNETYRRRRLAEMLLPEGRAPAR